MKGTKGEWEGEEKEGKCVCLGCVCAGTPWSREPARRVGSDRSSGWSERPPGSQTRPGARAGCRLRREGRSHSASGKTPKRRDRTRRCRSRLWGPAAAAGAPGPACAASGPPSPHPGQRLQRLPSSGEALPGAQPRLCGGFRILPGGFGVRRSARWGRGRDAEIPSVPIFS